MKNIIKCKNCGTEIEISEILIQQIEAEVSVTSEEKHRKETEEAVKLAEAKLLKENDEEKERNKKLTSQMGELLDEIKALRRKDEERDFEMKKKMMDEEERVRQEVRKQADEENQLENLKKDQKLNEALKRIDELKNKMQEGSQQTQGEVVEIELERLLKTEFPEDVIGEVKKGERGADIVQEVIDKRGKSSGIILWETKNAQWKNEWVVKLKEDQRNKKSDLAVLVTINKPEGLDTFMYKDGIWLTTWKFAIPLALVLRFSLISVNHQKTSSQGKDEKKEVLYQYLTGTEFKYRLEAIVEAFNNLQKEQENEKRWFSAKWGRQEKNLRKVLDHTCGMYGDLQGIIGRSLPEIKTLELLDESQIEIVVESAEPRILS